MEHHTNLDLADIKYIDHNNICSIEKWNAVTGYVGHYEVSDLGRVRSIKRSYIDRWNKERILHSRIMHQHTNDRGYLSVHLSKDAIGKHPRVNRLVAIAFIPNPENKPEVGHIKGNKKDNRVCSLKWETRLENMQHAFKTGLIKPLRLEDSKSAKLTNEQVLNIRASKLTPKEMSLIYPVSASCICKIIARINWKHI